MYSYFKDGLRTIAKIWIGEDLDRVTYSSIFEMAASIANLYSGNRVIAARQVVTKESYTGKARERVGVLSDDKSS